MTPEPIAAHTPAVGTMDRAASLPHRLESPQRYLKLLAAVAVILLVREAEPFLVPVVVAVVFTFLLSSPVRNLHKRGVPEVWGAGILIIALLGAGTFLLSNLLGPATQWWERLPTTTTALVERIDRLRSTIPLLTPPAPARNAPRGAAPPADPIKEKLATESMALTGLVIRQTLSFTLSAAATVLLLYFLLASEHWMLSRTVQAVPRRRARALLLSGIRSAQREIGRYLATLSLINIGVGVATALAMNHLDMPNPVLWGTVAGILNFIPYIGPIMIVALLSLAGLITFEDTLTAIAPGAYFMLIHAVESNFISPWFVGRRLALSRVSVFLSVMFWGWAWGMAGAMLAVPILIGLRNFCKRNRRYRWLSAYLEDSGKVPATLRSLMRKRSPQTISAPPTERTQLINSDAPDNMTAPLSDVPDKQHQAIRSGI